MNSLKRSIVETLIYSDIFDYPLTKNEIWYFLISNQKIDKVSVGNYLENKLPQKKGFYYLPKKEEVVEKRIEREKESNRKIKIAKKISTYLFFIPTIRLIGISGNLSMKNAQKNDDIDLFIIAQKNTLWMTRLFIILILELLRSHRRKFDKKVRDKICLNMMIDETSLCLPINRQNLFTAHEVLQMMSLFERCNMYEKFISSNNWVFNFLPNSSAKRIVKTKKSKDLFINKILNINFFYLPVELLAKKIQLWYMDNNRTKEVVLNNFLAFHPKDLSEKVLSAYKKGISKIKI